MEIINVSVGAPVPISLYVILFVALIITMCIIICVFVFLVSARSKVSSNMPAIRLHACFDCCTRAFFGRVILIFKLIVGRVLAVINHHRWLFYIFQLIRVALTFVWGVIMFRSSLWLRCTFFEDSCLPPNIFGGSHVWNFNLLLFIILLRWWSMLIQILWTSTTLKHCSASPVCCSPSTQSLMSGYVGCVSLRSIASWLDQSGLLIQLFVDFFKFLFQNLNSLTLCFDSFKVCHE